MFMKSNSHLDTHENPTSTNIALTAEGIKLAGGSIKEIDFENYAESGKSSLICSVEICVSHVSPKKGQEAYASFGLRSL